MSANRSFRSRLLVGSVAWTMGLLLVVSVFLVVFLAAHPQPHRVILRWFLTVPAALVAVVGAACMVVGVWQIRRGFSAVDELRGRLAAVRRGDLQGLPGSYPSEVQPLVDDLNILLADRAQRVERAAAVAGDLAHGLKTPLAVLARDAERASAAGEIELAGSITSQIDRMRQQVDYHLAGARASAAANTPGITCALAPVIRGLVHTLERLHADRGLHFEQDVPPDHFARCSRADVEEMLGNLLDNACKWGRTTVRVTSVRQDGDMVLTVDDDGPGLDPALAMSVIARGVRADERVPGSGLGLAIVRQLADVYGGSIDLVASPFGGLRARLTLRAGSPGSFG
jgi:signal transduction histidine kinase